MGGSARRWQTALRVSLGEPRSFRLRLVMTKFGPPAVRVAYAISLAP